MRLFVFTTHKTGSMFLHRFFGKVSEVSGIKKYSKNDMNFDLARPLDFTEIELAAAGIYAPLRYEVKSIPTSVSDCYIFHLRDPRDMLTSLYYSHSYSHVTRDGAFNPTFEERASWVENGIDKFIVDYLEDGLLQNRYKWMLEEARIKKHCSIVSRYELMVRDYSVWGERIIGFLNQNAFSLNIKDFEIFESEFKAPASEDITKHKRKMIPGDFRNKLKTSTIELINDQFRSVIDAMSYSYS